MPVPSDPQVLEPDPDDGVRIVSAGIVGWFLALLASLIRRDALVARGAQWWTWTCVSGIGIGVLMLMFAKRRARAYREHSLQPEPSADSL